MAVISSTEAGAPELVRFLDMIAHSEGTSEHPLTRHDGYDVIVSSIEGPSIFTDFSDHPFASGRAPQVVRAAPRLLSTAAGRYQLLLRYWPSYRTELGLTDFSPLSQDRVALRQIREARAFPDIEAGRISQAITRCSSLWASFPGNVYGEGGRSMEHLGAWWQNATSQQKRLLA